MLATPRVLELERSAVFGYGADDVVRRTGRHLGLDFQRDIDLGPKQATEVLHYRAGDLIDVPRKTGRVDLRSAVEAA